MAYVNWNDFIKPLVEEIELISGNELFNDIAKEFTKEIVDIFSDAEENNHKIYTRTTNKESNRYVVKDPIIEAFQYDGDLMTSNGQYYVPEWAVVAHNYGILKMVSFDHGIPELCLMTDCENFTNKFTVIEVGDFITKDKHGNIGVMNEEEFKKTYEKF